MYIQTGGLVLPGLRANLILWLVRGTGVVPPQGCLLKAHFMTMMLFPDQTGA